MCFHQSAEKICTGKCQSLQNNKNCMQQEQQNQEVQPTLTFGQKAVGLSFNPSRNPEVDKAKQIFADAIDQLNELRASTTSGEVKRMASVAITEAQTAQMWAVKALTWED